MSLTVLHVGYPFAPVNADPVGGAEQVLAQLDRALVKAGGRSIVVAPEGSAPAGELIATPAPVGEIDDAQRERIRRSVAKAVEGAIAEGGIDLVHMHGIDFDAYLPPPGPPTLVTLHLPCAWYTPEALNPSRPLTWLNPVSADQARRAPAEVKLTEPVDNGVDVDAFPRLSRRAYALALGRICPEKGFHLALEAAKRAGIPLLIAGEVFPYETHLRYFAEEIEPRLDAQRRWIGPVSGARKRRLMAGARCLLVPSLAPETSSLVAREAAAAGTPVIAFCAGALAETVEDGRTGFLTDNAEEMADAIGKVDRVNPEVCRAAARERFSLDRMVDGYFSLYRRLIAAAAERPKSAHAA